MASRVSTAQTEMHGADRPSLRGLPTIPNRLQYWKRRIPCVQVYLLYVCTLLCSCGPGKPKHALLLVASGPNTQTLGIVRQGSPVHGNFVLHNPTTQTVRIGHVDADCQCTSVLVPAEEVAPGQNVTVSLEVADTQLREGRLRAQVRISVATESLADTLVLAVDAYVSRGKGLLFMPEGEYVGSMKRNARRTIQSRLILGPGIDLAEPVIASDSETNPGISLLCGELLPSTSREDGQVETWVADCTIVVADSATVGPFDLWFTAMVPNAGHDLLARAHVAGEVAE